MTVTIPDELSFASANSSASSEERLLSYLGYELSLLFLINASRLKFNLWMETNEEEKKRSAKKEKCCTQIEGGLIADALVRLQLPSFSLRIWQCDAKSRDYYRTIDHHLSRQPPTSRISTL